MIFNLLLSGGDIISFLISLIILVPAMMFALSLHETAHGFVAWKCGDPTAHNLGRLSLNPLRHLDPVGLVFLLLFGYGWAKPVPVNARYFRNPKWGMAITALAGPISNLLFGLICAVLGGTLYGVTFYLGVTGFKSGLLGSLDMISSALYLSAYINFLYTVFNMIPIPPFDGSRVAFAFLPEKYYFGIMRYERQIMLGLLIAMIVLSRIGFSPVNLAAEWLCDQVYIPVAKTVYGALIS